MIVRVTLANGRRIYKDEGKKIKCYNPSDDSYFYCDVMESIGNYFQFNKKITTNESLKRICDMQLDFNLGYCIGLTCTKVFRRKDDTALFAFRCKNTRDEFVRLFEDKCNKIKVYRYAIGIGRRDDDWYKLDVDSPKYFEILDKLKIKPMVRMSTWWQKVVPSEFKAGMLVGICDSHGLVNRQVREKLGDAINFFLNTSVMSHHYMIQGILNGVDVLTSESITYSSGRSKNRTYISKRSVVENIDVFRLCKSEFIENRIEWIKNPKHRDKEFGCRDKRWSKIKSIDYHMGSVW